MAAGKQAVTIGKPYADSSIAVLTLEKEPVNSMNLAFWKSLLAAFEQVNADDTVRCIIFQSGLKKNVFTAGLDFLELYAPKTTEKKLYEFWGTLSKCLTSIYGCSKLTIAAIAGACPAGGCCLALCCDVRVITEDGSMGLNEVALGMPVPLYWVRRMSQCIGHHETERMLLRALMPKAPELLKIGMVDHVVPLDATLEQTRATLMGYCVKYAQTNCLNYPDNGFSTTKSFLRKSFYEEWAAGGPTEEAALVWAACNDKRTVASLTKVMEQMQKKPKGPKAKL